MTNCHRDSLCGRALIFAMIIVLIAGCEKTPEEYVASGRDYVSKQDHKAAIIQFKNALTAKPNYAEARYLLGVSLLKTYDFASAEKELRKAREFNYPAEQTAPALAAALVEQGKYSEVASQFGSIALSDPQSDSQLKVQVAYSLLALGKQREASELFGKALAFDPQSPSARVGQARIAAMNGRLDEAKRVIDSVLASSPRQIEALSLLAEIEFSQNHADAGIEQLKKIVQLRPDRVEDRFSLGLALLSKGQRDSEVAQQVAAIRKIAANDPRALHLQSVLELNRGNVAGARDLALNVLKSDPNYVPGLVVAGAANLQLRNYDQAIDNLQKAVKFAPAHIYARRLLTAAYLANGSISSASRTVENGLKEAPNDRGLLALAGEVSLARGDLDVAAQNYEEAAKAGAIKGAFASRLAQIRFAQGRTDMALHALETGAVSSDKQYQSDLALALYHLQAGDVTKAFHWIDSLQKKQPTNPIVPTLSGLAYAKKGDRDTARKQFERALELQTSFVPALEGLALLDVIGNKPDAAQKRFETVLAKDPKAEAVALSYVKFLLSQRAQPAKTADVLEHTVRAEPTALNARIALIRTYLQMNEAAKAVTLAQEALAAAPENAVLLQLAGETQLAARDYKQAIATFERLVTLRPGVAEPLLLVAQAYDGTGDQQRTLDALTRALAIKPDLLSAQVALMRVHVKAKRTDEALAVAKSMQRQRPKEAIGYLSEAEILQQTKQWKQRVTVLERGLQQTASASFIPLLHRALVDLHRDPDADKLVSNWLKANPKDIYVRSYLAERSLIHTQYASAERAYKEILSIQPNTPLALNNLAWVARQTKDPKSLEYAEEANRLLPNYPPIMDTLGSTLVERGQVDRGLALLQKAVQAAPGAVHIRINLAKALIRSGQKQEARKELEYLTSQGMQDATAKTEVQELLKQL